MTHSADAAFSEFYQRHHQEMVRFVAKQGVSPSDVDDTVQTIFVKAYVAWPVIRQPRAFIYRVARNEITALWRRQQRDRTMVEGWAVSRSAFAIGEDTYGLGNVSLVRDCLSALPPRLREVLAAAIDGCGPNQTARALNITPAAARVHMCHVRKTLGPLLTDEGGNDLLQTLLGRRLFQAWTAGRRLPTTPRPVVTRGWALSEKQGLKRERAAGTDLLDRDEVDHRREELPFSTCRWLLDALTDIGSTGNMIAVIADADGVVLWVGGHRGMRRQAEKKAFVIGSPWGLKSQGSNGISMAIIDGRPVRLSRWEHYIVVTHEDFFCYAVPLYDPRTERPQGVLNLTGAEPISHRLTGGLDLLAGRVRQQLLTL